MLRYFYTRNDSGNITGTYAFSTEENVFAFGYARVNPKEQGEKLIGREIAQSRMYDAFDLFANLSEDQDVLVNYKVFPKDAKYPSVTGMALDINKTMDFVFFRDLNIDYIFALMLEDYHANRLV